MKAATLLRQDDELREKISIHAAREGGDADELSVYLQTSAISIHAAREGGDLFKHLRYITYRISIHAAREGGDAASAATASTETEFQSTPPVKAATGEALFMRSKSKDFNPRRP